MIKIKILDSNEKLVGGAGDNKSDNDFDPRELQTGIDDESGEHTKDPAIAKEIAKDHLSKDPDYYKKAKKAGLSEKTSRKLSDYWRVRAKRRALKSKRSWPNAVDHKWALKEQYKSKVIDRAVQKLFEKDLQLDEETNDIVKGLLEKLKKNREEKNKLKVKKFGPGTANKPSGSISKKYPPHKKGEGVAGYYKRVSKSMGGATLAPGESIG